MILSHLPYTEENDKENDPESREAFAHFITQRGISDFFFTVYGDGTNRFNLFDVSFDTAIKQYRFEIERKNVWLQTPDDLTPYTITTRKGLRREDTVQFMGRKLRKLHRYPSEQTATHFALFNRHLNRLVVSTAEQMLVAPTVNQLCNVKGQWIREDMPQIPCDDLYFFVLKNDKWESDLVNGKQWRIQ